MNWDDVKNLLLAAKDDYSQLFDKDSRIGNDTNLLMQKLSQNVPSNADFRNPQAMSQWAQAAALNAPMMGVVGKLPPTKFSQAHDLAQKNAALPIEQGGLGLPPNNTAMDRARAMGFDIDNIYFHGTARDIDQIKTSIRDRVHGQRKDNAGVAWLTNNPESAGHYANMASAKKEYGSPSRAITSNLVENKDKRMFEVGKPELYSLLSGQNISPVITKGEYKRYAMTDFFNNELSAKDRRTIIQDSILDAKNNYDGVLFKNVDDPINQNALAAFKSKNIRSKFAAFDPLKKDSANLLASILLGTSLYGNYGGDQ